MPGRKQKTLANIPTKVMRRKKPINLEHLKTIEPLTENQEKIWKAYGEEQNLVLHGAQDSAPHHMLSRSSLGFQ